MNSFHAKNLQYLKTALEKGQLHHSYVFYGAAGSGKFDFALRFAEYLQGSKEGAEYIPNTYILNKGKDESITKDEILEAKKSIELSSFDGKLKIVIINNSQNITYQVRDLLLKTLEEPTRNSLLILITDRKDMLPKTILSRCPALFFPRMSLNKIREGGAGVLGGEELSELSYILSAGNLDFLEDLKKENRDDFVERSASRIKELEGILMGESQFAKLVLAKKIDGEQNVSGILKNWVALLYWTFLFKQKVVTFDKGTERQLKNLEKNLEYDKIILVIEKILHYLSLMETNVSKRLLLEDLVLSV